MSKSLDYAIAMDGKRQNKNTSTERLASNYMDWILKGERELVKDTKVGVIKSVVDFDPNGDFNFLNSWSGTISGQFDEEALEEQLIYVSNEELNDYMRVPCDENNVPLGGMPENGDTIHVTFGNYVVNVSNQEEDSCYVSVALPMHYELIKGKQCE